jgi:hypothetical protein
MLVQRADFVLHFLPVRTVVAALVGNQIVRTELEYPVDAQRPVMHQAFVGDPSHGFGVKHIHGVGKGAPVHGRILYVVDNVPGAHDAVHAFDVQIPIRQKYVEPVVMGKIHKGTQAVFAPKLPCGGEAVGEARGVPVVKPGVVYNVHFVYAVVYKELHDVLALAECGHGNKGGNQEGRFPVAAVQA